MASKNKTSNPPPNQTQPPPTANKTTTRNSKTNNQLPKPSSYSQSVNNHQDPDPNDPLRTLTDHQITQIATLLRLPAQSEHSNITTNHQGWLRDQAEQIARNLDEGLKEPPEDKILRRLSLGIFCLPVGTTIPTRHDEAGQVEDVRLCGAHRGLRRDIIAGLFGQLRSLLWGGSWGRLCWLSTTATAMGVAVPGVSCDLGIGLELDDFHLGDGDLGFEQNKRSRERAGPRMTGASEEQATAREAVQEFMNIIIGVSALTTPERELRDRFGPYLDSAAARNGGKAEGKNEKEEDGQSQMFAGPNDTRFKYIASGCEACVLATIGRGGGGIGSKGGQQKNNGLDVLAALRAAFLARGKSTTRPGQAPTAGEGGKPGLLRLIEAWIALDEKEHGIAKTSDNLVSDLGRERRQVGDRDEQERRATVARGQHGRVMHQRGLGDQPRQQGQPRRHQENQQQRYPRQMSRGKSGQRGESGSLPTSSRQQPQQKHHQRHHLHDKYQGKQEQYPTGEKQDAGGGKVAQLSESTPRPQSQAKEQQQVQQQRSQRDLDDTNDVLSSTPTMPFTGTSQGEEKERLPTVHANILPWSLAPHNQQLQRRAAKGNLREAFQETEESTVFHGK